MKAFQDQGGINYFTGKKMDLNEVMAHNFIHVLSKKQFHYFKYFPKNIILGDLIHHKLIDQGTCEELAEHLELFPREAGRWKEFYALLACLKSEYKDWVDFNGKKFKL